MLSAYAQSAQVGPAAPNPILGFLPMIFIIGIFYFLVIKPQKKQQANHKQMISELSKNDEIVTSGGLCGTIVNVKDKTFVVRIDDNTKVEILKGYVLTVIKKKS
jgi:preprotein translocase subunit YajC